MNLLSVVIVLLLILWLAGLLVLPLVGNLIHILLVVVLVLVLIRLVNGRV